MRALITGINGFVGRYLAEYLLAKNIEVYGTYFGDMNEDELSEVNLLRMDISNQYEVDKVIKKIQPNYVFHLAAQSSASISWKEPKKTIEVNVNGTLNLLESIRQLDNKCRILLIGSSEEYGFVNLEDIPVNEEQSLKPGNPYAVSKIAQSMIGQVYARAYNMDVIIVKAFNHIGPKQSPTFVVSDFSKRIAEIEKGKIPPVLKVGNLEAERDFTDVRDIVRAYYEIILKGKKGEVYNVGSGNSYKIQEILDTLLSLAKINIKVEKDPNRMRPSDIPIIRCDHSKVIDITEWKPEYKIEKTLSDVLNYWRQTV
ncbi:GDP-mannose 4,6-dehydratase [Anaerophilus nitritogenes]|uniref:GDP-mannose 4,6-dehydratase n=1 Tax=Anaerophilus nitritogenes TaxID=2498136 RepID=UPI00101D630F|nr:GDP-mannose 4,6-dehydratase [Anaerophilus nitritogenes]